MAVSYRTGITILQIIFFLPSMCIAVGLCFFNGLQAAGTWRFIATLSALRVAGDISYFISLTHPTLNVEVAVIVCELMGLAPLMLTLVALVGRVITNSFPTKAVFVISTMSLVGLIIGIAGADRALKAATDTDSVAVNGLMKGALALFLAGFGLMLLGWGVVAVDLHRHPDKRQALGQQTRFLVAVALAAPFVCVRLVYGALGDYTGQARFSVLYGSDTLYLCLGILMEMLSVSICLSCAFLVPVTK